MFDPIGIIQISAWSYTVTTVGQKNCQYTTILTKTWDILGSSTNPFHQSGPNMAHESAPMTYTSCPNFHLVIIYCSPCMAKKCWNTMVFDQTFNFVCLLYLPHSLIRAIFGTRDRTHGILYYARFHLDWYTLSKWPQRWAACLTDCSPRR